MQINIGLTEPEFRPQTAIFPTARNGSSPVFEVKRKEPAHFIRIHKDGYEIYKVSLSQDIAAWYWGNYISGGFIGTYIDGRTGATHKIIPKKIDAVLVKEVKSDISPK